MRHVLAIACAALLLMGAAPAPAPIVEHETARFFGHVKFCEEHPGDCVIDTRQPERVHWTRSLEARLQRVTREVNARITQVEDSEHWAASGVDIWDYAEDGMGDCEDIQLVKRRELKRLGVPFRAMRMVLVMKGMEGHAVLAVLTDRGPRILDNMNDEVKFPEQTGYRFIKRESSFQSGGWVDWDNNL
jgi:predicted transglutaminase-like cysteine proteinase